jgi:hypothetical protein
MLHFALLQETHTNESAKFDGWTSWGTTGHHVNDLEDKKGGIMTIETAITRPTRGINGTGRVYNNGAIVHTNHKYGTTLLHIFNVYVNPSLNATQVKNVFRQLAWSMS